MATVKVKFRPSTVADREGTIYYHLSSTYKCNLLGADNKQ